MNAVVDEEYDTPREYEQEEDLGNVVKGYSNYEI